MSIIAGGIATTVREFQVVTLGDLLATSDDFPTTGGTLNTARTLSVEWRLHKTVSGLEMANLTPGRRLIVPNRPYRADLIGWWLRARIGENIIDECLPTFGYNGTELLNLSSGGSLFTIVDVKLLKDGIHKYIEIELENGGNVPNNARIDLYESRIAVK